jgi:hypothetical protein
MKRGHIVLLSGAVLLVAGIVISAVWAIPFAGSFLSNNTILAKTSIDPGKSLDIRTTEVYQLDRPISLAIGIDRSPGQQPQVPSSSQQPSAIRLKEVVTDPNGRVISSNEFGDSFFTSFKPEAAGVYTVTVSNLGTEPVSISGAFGYMSFVGSDGKPDINSMMGGGGGLGMIITGGALAAVGVVTLIVGAIITVADSRSREQSSRTMSEGGITYRKD